jgi:hypothetical protein
MKLIATRNIISPGCELLVGNIPTIAKKIGINQATIHRWIRKGVLMAIEGEWLIYLNVEKIKKNQI